MARNDPVRRHCAALEGRSEATRLYAVAAYDLG
jgi:hypothetical protein